MKPLIIGVILFLIWASLSTWYYVCHVRDFCSEPDMVSQVQAEEAKPAQEAIPKVGDEIIALPESAVIQFAYNSDKVIPGGSSLETFLTECKSYLEKKPDAVVMITGHTCSIGTSTYNADLGMRRAVSSGTWLSNNGVPTNKIQTFSKGEDEPVADNSTNSGREKNRRSVLTIKN